MDESAAVRGALDALDAAFERRDLNAVLDLCTEDVVFIGSGDGEEAIGREAIGREAIGPMFASLAPQLEGLQFSLTWDSVDVNVLGDVAILVGWGDAKLVTSRRDETIRYRLTGLLVRSNGRWLWRVHHCSDPQAW